MRQDEKWAAQILGFRQRVDDLADLLVEGLPRAAWRIARFVRACFVSNLRLATVASVTRRTRIPARTLSHQCRQLGLMPPHEILALCKCMAAARAIRMGASVTEASLEYGYAQPKTLRSAFKRFLGFAPSQSKEGRKPTRIQLRRTGLNSRARS